MPTPKQEQLYTTLSAYADTQIFRRGSKGYIAIGIAEGKGEKDVNAVSIRNDDAVSFFTFDTELLQRLGRPCSPLKELKRPPSKPIGPRDEDGYQLKEVTIEFVKANEEDFKKLVRDSIKIVTSRYKGK